MSHLAWYQAVQYEPDSAGAWNIRLDDLEEALHQWIAQEHRQMLGGKVMHAPLPDFCLNFCTNYVRVRSGIPPLDDRGCLTALLT